MSVVFQRQRQRQYQRHANHIAPYRTVSSRKELSEITVENLNSNLTIAGNTFLGAEEKNKKQIIVSRKYHEK